MAVSVSEKRAMVTAAFVELKLVTNSVLPSWSVSSRAKSKQEEEEEKKNTTTVTHKRGKCFHSNQVSFHCFNFFSEDNS